MNYGRYQIQREIGKGSMGIVFEAHDPNLDLMVALKVLRHDRVVSDAFVRRFLVEAKALGRLDNPNIVRVYNVDEDGGTVYIAMEFIEGESLDDAMRRKRFRPEEIVELGATVAETLDYAHRKGIVHRDIKPSNILLRSDGRLKITDFGIAHVEDPSGLAQTQAGEILGTPAYMSPEQVLGRPADGRSDLFSLGIILYEMSTGSRPFKGENLAAIFHAITSDEPPAADKRNPAISAELSRVIMRCLRKTPEERFATGSALGAALRGCLIAKAAGEERGPLVLSFLKRNFVLTLLGIVITAGSLGGLIYHFSGLKKGSPEVAARSGGAILPPAEEPERKAGPDGKSTQAGAEIVTDSGPKEERPATLEALVAKRQVQPAEKPERKGSAAVERAPAKPEAVTKDKSKGKAAARQEASTGKNEVQAAAVRSEKPGEGRLVRGVVAEGACAIPGMSSEQSQFIALQKARAVSIEKATGVRVASSSLVQDGTILADLIRTYFRGFIVKEKVEWLPISQNQVSPDRPPIPEYRVRINADVAIPEGVARPTGLSAKLNSRLFRKGEKARLEIVTEKESRVAVFNFTADDQVVMLFPHIFEKENMTSPGKPFKFPPEGSRLDLLMQPLPSHPKDTEAFFVVAVGKEDGVDYMATFGVIPMPFATFFERYAKIASRAEEVILPYVVEGNE